LVDGLAASWPGPVGRDEVASVGVLTHPIDEQVRRFYRRWDFEGVPFDPKRSVIVRMIDLEKSGLVT
jgi:hypothetical protein